MINLFKKTIVENKNIFLSSFLNFLFKNLIVLIVIDFLKLNPNETYIFILFIVYIFSFISNLKIGFSKSFELRILIKWIIIHLFLLIVENYLFMLFESIFEYKVILSVILSIFIYILRFFFNKKIIFN